MLSHNDMRTFMGLVIAVGIGAAVLVQKQRQQSKPAAEITETTAVARASAAPSAAAAGPASEQNWPKRALDRAAEVKRQVAEQHKQNDTK